MSNKVDLTPIMWGMVDFAVAAVFIWGSTDAKEVKELRIQLEVLKYKLELCEGKK